jgi:hypothetical protein
VTADVVVGYVLTEVIMVVDLEVEYADVNVVTVE